MCKQEKTVKVKSYYSKVVTFTPFLAAGFAFFIILYIIAMCEPDDYPLIADLILSGIIIIVCVVMPAYLFLATYVFCNVDIYSETGIKRVKGKKVIFEVKWENINEITYAGLYGILFQTPFCIIGESKIKLTEKPQVENLSYDTKTFWTPVKLKGSYEIDKFKI